MGGAMASSLWQWFFEGGDSCGFKWFPIFGMTAARFGCVISQKADEWTRTFRLHILITHNLVN
jgi:hypothetical protein